MAIVCRLTTKYLDATCEVAKMIKDLKEQYYYVPTYASCVEKFGGSIPEEGHRNMGNNSIITNVLTVLEDKVQ